MYDDKKYSPCYNGYRIDLLFLNMTDCVADRPKFSCSLVELGALHLALYRRLNSREQT